MPEREDFIKKSAALFGVAVSYEGQLLDPEKIALCYSKDRVPSDFIHFSNEELDDIAAAFVSAQGEGALVAMPDFSRYPDA